MEDTLGAIEFVREQIKQGIVLILVIMEDTLGVKDFMFLMFLVGAS